MTIRTTSDGALDSAGTSARQQAIDDVVSTAALRAAGTASSTISARCRPGGPWRRLLPGVILLSGAEPTRKQLVRAALCQLGDQAVVTGADALCAHGLRVPRPRAVHLLVPPGRRARAGEHTILERTARLPRSVLVDGIPVAPLARALIDTARRERSQQRIRQLLERAVQAGQCSADALHAELDAGSQRGTAAVRGALRELGACYAGSPTSLHARARRFVARTQLPQPVWDVIVCDRRGRPIGRVDAWWEQVGMGWRLRHGRENDERQAPGTCRREQLAMAAAGVVLVHTHADRLGADATGLSKELTSALRAAARRPRPPVRVAHAGGQ